MKFKGKNGPVLWLALLLDFGIAGWFWTLKGEFETPLIFWCFMALYALIAAVIVSFMSRNTVTVTESEIRVSLGPTNAWVDIASVVSMKKAVSFLASSGASAKRVEIVYRKKGGQRLLYVSPADRDGFIRAVKEKNPEIKVY